MSQKLFSIRNVSQNAPLLFHLQTTKYPIKTTMVVFQKELHAIHMARLIESHKSVTGDWPNTDFASEDGTFNFMSDSLTNHNANIELRELEVIQWDEDKLVRFCQDNFLDALRIDSFGKDDEVKSGEPDRTVIKGLYIQLEGDLDRLKAYLEKKMGSQL